MFEIVIKFFIGINNNLNEMISVIFINGGVNNF